jgi:hypothetical protein
MLIHTRGFGDMEGPVYCAEKKPCKLHKFQEPGYESDFDRFVKEPKSQFKIIHPTPVVRENRTGEDPLPEGWREELIPDYSKLAFKNEDRVDGYEMIDAISFITKVEAAAIRSTVEKVREVIEYQKDNLKLEVNKFESTFDGRPCNENEEGCFCNIIEYFQDKYSKAMDAIEGSLDSLDNEGSHE